MLYTCVYKRLLIFVLFYTTVVAGWAWFSIFAFKPTILFFLLFCFCFFNIHLFISLFLMIYFFFAFLCIKFCDVFFYIYIFSVRNWITFLKWHKKRTMIMFQFFFRSLIHPKTNLFRIHSVKVYTF